LLGRLVVFGSASLQIVGTLNSAPQVIRRVQVDYSDVAPYSKIKVPGYAEPVEFGVLTSFAYKLEEAYKDYEGKEVGEIVVATTRPETMIGDTGIAVHPDDPRYPPLSSLDQKCLLSPVASYILEQLHFDKSWMLLAPCEEQYHIRELLAGEHLLLTSAVPQWVAQ
jgi:hypothetical protein